ncbi:MAG: carbohydrate kinase family protein [Paracoccaceae bacterium]
MTSAFDVLAIGELNPDLILSGFAVDAPVLGTEQAFDRQTMTLGSSSAIACVLMQRLGLRTAMAAMVGNDDHGRYCRDILNENGVDTRGVKFHASLATGITISLSYPADRMLLTRYGTMTAFGMRDIEPILLAGARHLHVGSFYIQSGLRPDLTDVFRAARARGQSTSLDLGWDPADRWETDILSELLPHVSIVFPNRIELKSVTRTDDISSGLLRLHDLGARGIALKLGGEGAVWSDRHGKAQHKGFSVKVVDTTGAGDAFNAGFLRSWLDGLDPWDCLALGNACGALTTQSVGGVGGLKNLAQARALIDADGAGALNFD